MYGHISNAEITAITTTLKEIPLGAYDADSAPTRDARSQAMPGAGYMDAIEFRFTYTGGPPTTLTLALYYDAARTLPAAGPIVLSAASASNPNGIEIDTGAAMVRGAVEIAKRFRVPAGATRGGMHLFVSADAGTLAAPAAAVRLQWASNSGGQR